MLQLHYYPSNASMAPHMHMLLEELGLDDESARAHLKSHAEAGIGAMLDQLDAELARHGQPWLLGECFSAVDPYVLMLCRWTRGLARPARALPQLGPYLQRVLARPATRRVFEREVLAQAGTKHLRSCAVQA